MDEVAPTWPLTGGVVLLFSMRTSFRERLRESITELRPHAFWDLIKIALEALSGAGFIVAFFAFFRKQVQAHVASTVVLAVATISLASFGITVWRLRRTIRDANTERNAALAKVAQMTVECQRAKSELEVTTQKCDLLSSTLKASQDTSSRLLRMVEMEGYPLTRLTQYVSKRNQRKQNLVRLEAFSIVLDVSGPNHHKDVTAVYRITGENSSGSQLTAFNLTIDGDGAARFQDLHAQAFDLLTDPKREHPLHPRRDGPFDGRDKNLALLFRAPGIYPGGHFDLELTYIWPDTFHLPRDYWFVDDADAETSAKKVSLEIRFDRLLELSGRVYAFDLRTSSHTFIGAAEAKPGRLLYENPHPGEGTIYVMIVEEHESASGIRTEHVARQATV